MNTFAIVKDGIIENIIRSGASFAKLLGALPMYEGAAIGKPYAPNTQTPVQQREEAYNTQLLVEWEGQMLTVTQAATKWYYYAAEGSAKADELRALIAAAKQTIREQYPDEEVSE